MSDRKHIALLLGRGSESIEAAVRRMARSHGFDVDRLECGEEILATAAFDLIIADVDVPGRWTGLELVGALRELGLGARAILIGSHPTFADCRRALRLGASDFLTTPVPLPELFAAIERALLEEAPARANASASTEPHARTYTASSGAVECAARDLLAFLVQRGIGPSHRLRIASAAAEIVDNATRHAYSGGDSGVVRLRASHADERVTVDVEDGGAGFDTAAFELDGANGAAARAASSGLIRAKRLSDAMQLESDKTGTRAHLEFATHAVTFDENGSNFTEVDYLVPGEARRLLRELANDHENDPVELAPSLLPTVGRLLTAFDLDPMAANAPRS